MKKREVFILTNPKRTADELTVTVCARAPSPATMGFWIGQEGIGTAELRIHAADALWMAKRLMQTALRLWWSEFWRQTRQWWAA